MSELSEELRAAIHANAGRHIAFRANEAANVIADFIPLIESPTELASARHAQSLLFGIRDYYSVASGITRTR